MRIIDLGLLIINLRGGNFIANLLRQDLFIDVLNLIPGAIRLLDTILQLAEKASFARRMGGLERQITRMNT